MYPGPDWVRNISLARSRADPEFVDTRFSFCGEVPLSALYQGYRLQRGLLPHRMMGFFKRLMLPKRPVLPNLRPHHWRKVQCV